IQGNRDAPQTLRCAQRPVEPGSVVADDGQLITALKPKRCQPEGEGLHLRERIGPTICLPNAAVFLAHGGLAKTEALRIPQEQSGECCALLHPSPPYLLAVDP